jgi:hypothetical protein
LQGGEAKKDCGEGENFLQEAFPLSTPLPFSRTFTKKGISVCRFFIFF